MSNEQIAREAAEKILEIPVLNQYMIPEMSQIILAAIEKVTLYDQLWLEALADTNDGLLEQLQAAQAAIAEHNKYRDRYPNECLNPITIDLSALDKHDEEVRKEATEAQCKRMNEFYKEHLKAEKRKRKPLVGALEETFREGYREGYRNGSSDCANYERGSSKHARRLSDALVKVKEGK